MRLTRAQIVEGLKHEGYSFIDFDVVYEGDYLPEDVDWNYKDMVHLNFVHNDVGQVLYTPVESDVYGSILQLGLLGTKIPVSTVSFSVEPNTRTTFQTMFFFILIAEERYGLISPGRTRVTSIYSAGSPWFLKWCLPILRRMVTANKHKLMVGDVAMRDRRSLLRSWGYSFSKGGSPEYRCDYSLDIHKSCVTPPSGARSEPVSLSLDAELPGDGEKLLGRDDHLGLRLVRQGNRLAVYPRLCSHEGASLDGQPCRGNMIQCPWHGRSWAALAAFDLQRSERQESATPHHALSLEKGTLRISPR